MTRFPLKSLCKPKLRSRQKQDKANREGQPKSASKAKLGGITTQQEGTRVIRGVVQYRMLTQFGLLHRNTQSERLQCVTLVNRALCKSCLRLLQAVMERGHTWIQLCAQGGVGKAAARGRSCQRWGAASVSFLTLHHGLSVWQQLCFDMTYNKEKGFSKQRYVYTCFQCFTGQCIPCIRKNDIS